MLNIIWITIMTTAVVIAFVNGTTGALVQSVAEYAKLAFNISIGMAGIMAFWLGIMKIAEVSGLINQLAKGLRPLLRRLFPDVPADDPAMGAMVMNMAANMLGLSNAATPFGLKAMQQLQRLNPTPEQASNAMCTFLAINTSSVQLIPTTAIAFLAAAGASDPTSIILSALLATTCSTLVAIFVVKALQQLPRYRLRPVTEEPAA